MIKIRALRNLIIVLLVPSALLAQSDNGRVKAQIDFNVPDVRQIVESSIAATQRHWQARLHSTYLKRDENRRLDTVGRVRSEEVDVSRTILVNGVPFEQVVERNGRRPSIEAEWKEKENLDKLKRETSEQRAERLRKQEEETASLVREVPKAFDSQLIGEEMVNGRPAYILQATPRPDYHVQGKYGNMFSKVALDRQAGSGMDQGRRAGDPAVLDWTISGARAARLAHYDGANTCRRSHLDAGARRSTSSDENLFR